MFTVKFDQDCFCDTSSHRQNPSLTMTQSQQYCLRWNNHRANLLTVFDQLLRDEAFTDVTLVSQEGTGTKAHRMILAACSQYFQNIFTDLGRIEHTVVVLKDVKFSEIKAILDYMYHGEVNVAQDQLAGLLKVAEALKVKGLVEEHRTCKTEKEDPMPILNHSPSISSSNIVHNPVHSSSSNGSPPHSTNNMYKNSYRPYESKPQEHNSRHLNMWNVPNYLPPHSVAVPHPSHPNTAVTAATAMLSSAYENVSSDMSPLKRKKLSSHLMHRDTPILRTVLGQGQIEAQQPVSLVCHPDSGDMPITEERLVRSMKSEPSEDAQSPYTDFTERMTDEEEKSKLAIPSSSPQSFSRDVRTGVISGIATYVPSQNREWKRYKQYTRDDILSAIEAVRNGMSALQAARNYKVPSRTLYDKVKKLGITTSRPFKRGSNGSTGSFHYATGSPYRSHHLSEGEETLNNNKALLEASTFLQQTLDGGGDERDAFAAMAAVAAHAVAAGHSTSPNNMQARSPSPSPTMLKYMRRGSMTPSPINNSDQTNGSSERDREEEEDHVEDLSINRNHDVMESRVIMPPMNQVAAIMKKEEMLIDCIKEDVRRELRVEGNAN